MKHIELGYRGSSARTLLLVGAVAVASAAAPSAHAQLAPGAPTDGFELETWESGLSNATDIAFLSDGRAIITLKGGANGEVVVKQGDMIKRMAATIMLNRGNQNEQGLLGVVVDKDDNIYFYASAGDIPNKHKVYKATIGADNVITVNTEMPIVDQGLEGPANHDGGGMVIYKDQLYIGVGDTGSNRNPPQNKYASCLNKANGKILRVNLDGTTPADNPLNDVAMVTSCESTLGGTFGMAAPDKRIYAWGFRNPWRIWVDPKTDLIWTGDVGEQRAEEITVVAKGTHHGYPFEEGGVVHGAVSGLDGCMAVLPAGPCVKPAHAYGRGDGQSVTGGLAPTEGCGWGAYENKYFFGDYESNRVWTIDFNADRSGAVEGSRALFATVAGPTSFRMGPDGAMYIVSHKESSVTRLVPKMVPDTCRVAAAPDAGAPGPDAGQGVGGQGGAAGGASGSGGAGAGGNSGGSSGTAGSGGARGGAGSGGSSSNAGSGPANGADDGGCSCDVGARPGSVGWLPGGVLFGILLLGRRARRRRSE